MNTPVLLLVSAVLLGSGEHAYSTGAPVDVSEGEELYSDEWYADSEVELECGASASLLMHGQNHCHMLPYGECYDGSQALQDAVDATALSAFACIDDYCLDGETCHGEVVSGAEGFFARPRGPILNLVFLGEPYTMQECCFYIEGNPEVMCTECEEE